MKQGPHAEREASRGAWNHHELGMMSMPTMKVLGGITLNMHIWRNGVSNVSTVLLSENRS